MQFKYLHQKDFFLLIFAGHQSHKRSMAIPVMAFIIFRLFPGFNLWHL
jgi:hypothetical protein